MKVTLDIYSGRQNPSWELTPTQTSELLNRAARLRPSNVKGTFDKLGYRGLIVTGVATKILGFDELRISSGFVVGLGVAIEQTFLDTDRELERWLFGTSYGILDNSVRAFVDQELSQIR
jgi:hypothetical protein